ncbi:MAG: class I SAM-dependent methyltransferase [Rhodospirillaceae bacterium]|nr:class I SAM-dependent methyltransferase [Rhodospirillaceae bacterium]
MTQLADRGWIGRWERTPTLASESYLDFCEGIRKYAQEGTRAPAMAAAARATEQAKAKGLDLARVNDIRALFDPVPQIAVRNRMMRTLQEMTWRGLRDEFYSEKDKYAAELDAYDQKGPGKVEWNPDFRAPDYAKQPIHIQPGGYDGDPIAGYWYYQGTHSFFIGKNTQDEGHLGCANAARPPADGQVKRILDIGCSVGQITVGLKERFPNAEVWGIDTSAPMVRYAHKRAVDLNVDLNFSQRNAEATGWPDGHFDMITSYILFHEVRNDRIPVILKEVFRLLRPGGTFSIFDFPYDVKALPPFMRYFFDIDGKDNCEPYAMDFVTMDFTGTLKRTGFAVEPGPNQIYEVRTIYCTKAA